MSLPNCAMPVVVEVAVKITSLHELLQKEFGCDFSYVICAKGQIIAASDMTHGTMPPKVENS